MSLIQNKLLSFIFFLFLSFPSNAQETKNNIYLGTGYLFIPYPKTYYFREVYSQYYLSYERKIKKIHLGFSYAQWHNVWGDKRGYEPVYASQIGTHTKIDSINPHSRTKYRYYDIYLGNKIFKIKRHELTYGLGLSLASGWNDYVYDIKPWGVRHLGIKYSPLIHHYYIGVCSNAQYSMLLFKEKLKLGLSSRFSYHYKHLPQFTFNIQLGTSF